MGMAGTCKQEGGSGGGGTTPPRVVSYLQAGMEVARGRGFGACNSVAWPPPMHMSDRRRGGLPPGPPLLLACARHPHQHTANALAVQLVRELGFFRTARTGPASTACACVSELLLLLNSTAQRGL